MKYKALLFGNNNATMDDLFTHPSNSFELQTSSSRFDDLVSHVKYFEPDIIVYCMNSESPEIMKRLSSLKHDYLAQKECYIVIIGANEDCAALHRVAINVSDLELLRPISSAMIHEQVSSFLRKQELMKKMEEEEQAKAEAAAKTRAEIEAKKQNALKSGEQEKQKFLEKLATASIGGSNSTRQHILVVDDDPRMLKILKRHLENDYDVATAVNGKVALKFLENKTTNLILLDYEMPIQDGPSVLTQIRENDQTANIPVVFLTGINDREKIKTVLSLRPQGYLLKPIDKDTLMETIHKVLG